MKLFLSLLSFFTVFTCKAQQPKELAAVRTCFNNYKAAILANKAEDALKEVDANTRNYYTGVLDNIKHADSAAISTLPLIDKITILTIRARASKEEITAMKGTDAFIYAINNGMVGKSSVENVTPGPISINKNAAKMQVISGGQKTPLNFNFNKEDGKWHFDLTALFPITKQALDGMVNESGMDENSFLFAVLEKMTHKKITSAIWTPVE